MDIQSIIALINAVSEAEIMNFQVEEGNFRLSMDKTTQKIESSVPIPPNISASVPFISAPASVTAPIQIAEIPQVMEKPILSNGAVSALENAKDESIKEVKSPIVGTFYSASGSESEELAKVGDMVKVGQTLCIIEAMKLMNDIESDYKGEIVEILVKNEQMVEYGQPLFKIREIK